MLAALPSSPASAQAMPDAMGVSVTPVETLFLALIALSIGTAMLTAFWLIRQRAAIVQENEALRSELSESRSEVELRASLLAGDDQRLLLYRGGREPEVIGSLPGASGAPVEPRRFLAFSEWLEPAAALRLQGAIERLTASGEHFRIELDLPKGRLLEACGSTVGAAALVRFTTMAGMREAFTDLRFEHDRAIATIETMQALFDAAPMPLWLRDADGQLLWVNQAYAAAVDKRSVADVLSQQTEFFNGADRELIAARVKASGRFDDRLSTVVAADRRNFGVIETAGPIGSAGLATDVSEAETVRMELRQTIASHAETLDQLTTAVARFDERTHLIYHNAAFQKLFDLSAAYLDTAPDQMSMLDLLRSRGTLPEDRPLRELKNEILAAYRSTEPTDTVWHLADRRTLRVFASPQPQGGATWVFEDLTEKLELESRLRSLVRLQGETLDYLKEAVAVFGPDGRLRLSNPAFGEMWGLTTDFLAAKPRMPAIGQTTTVAFRPASAGAAPAVDWSHFTHAITAFDEGPRDTEAGEVELADGRILAYGIVPLPGGQTMLTFSDISDAREAERMLRERNEALEQANSIKTDFVQHVNYELRSPLTNIIGFSALLRSHETGPLNERQSEYLDYISTSTSALLTIVNDILDLATIDAGIMELELSDVDIAGTAQHAAEAIRDRLRENDIAIAIDVAAAGPSFRADAHRVTQILFNLLSNAANFAPSGSTVELTARRDAEAVSFAVTDHGPGIAPDQVARIFERFESDPVGGRQSGAGLGLSIVKSFVELHGGTVAVQSGPETGTTVICRFPLQPDAPGGGETSATDKDRYDNAAE
ncbi:ATP-binding protein [Mangrovicella endophytica]|uniref:sensor histidine kinase n=1 Tax=Mangrovicella endophytica TaxID=2066697 RepID=UPI001FE23093|nr:ATP-binding protein [Mangrovicella endophytica]